MLRRRASAWPRPRDHAACEVANVSPSNCGAAAGFKRNYILQWRPSGRRLAALEVAIKTIAVDVGAADYDPRALTAQARCQGAKYRSCRGRACRFHRELCFSVQQCKCRADGLIRYGDDIVNEASAQIVSPLRRHGRCEAVRDGVDAVHPLRRRCAKAAAHDIRADRFDAKYETTGLYLFYSRGDADMSPPPPIATTMASSSGA